MNIPLDRLYQFINNLANEIYGDRVIIYRFWPNGSKNIQDLNHLDGELPNNWYDENITPAIWCNDQEPLDHEFYEKNLRQPGLSSKFFDLLKSLNVYVPPKNLNYNKNIFEKGLLIHSEKLSSNLKKYKLDNNLIPVYYWSHAIIARDWFRYAEHVEQKKNVKKAFLIYNRAWAGTREYRLKFAELLIESGLENYCQISINPIEPQLGIHYKMHKFKNPNWQPHIVLENFFSINTAPSHYSADFDTVDYNFTDIEVVLETLFDDKRLHLTEKSLRPIACGQPFILASTSGSLEYLRSYGFKTFGHIWDEQYDLEQDSETRLIQIADLMKSIANWSPKIREQKMAQAQAIVEYNRKYFFSKEFFDFVIDELKTNLKLAFDEFEQSNNYKTWIDRWAQLISYPEIQHFLNSNQDSAQPTMSQLTRIQALIKNKLKGNNTETIENPKHRTTERPSGAQNPSDSSIHPIKK